MNQDGNRLEASSVSALDAHGVPAATRPSVIASIATRGTISDSVKCNKKRRKLLIRICAELTCADRPGDCAAVVFPGGFFHLDGFVGDRTASDRRAALEAADFAGDCRTTAARLAEVVPGAVLVVGVDSEDQDRNDQGWECEWADQMAVSWGPDGVTGVGRKVFPVAGEEANGMAINAADFGAAERVVDMPGGQRAILCSCYDAFGISDPGRRAKAVQRLRLDGRVLKRETEGFDLAFASAVNAWKAQLQDVNVALIAIHGFSEGGNTSMWQRHGIATASAALGGGLAIAGAHFETLPSCEGVQTLSALNVDRTHLDAGRHRPSASLMPIHAKHVGPALVRWYPRTK